jgi:phage tail sheath protein FI
MSGTDEFHHGITHKRVGNAVGPVQIADTNTVGFNLTAPDKDVSIPTNEPFLVFASDDELRTKLGAGGTAKKYLDAFFQSVGGGVAIVNIFEEGVSADATLLNAVGDQAANTGIFALEAAESLLGVRPKILATPGYTNNRVDNAANPLVVAQKGVVNRMGAVHITSGPNTTDVDAVAFRDDFDDERLIIFDPHVKTLDGIMTAEAHIAAAGVMTDKEIGYHASWGNKVLNILGPARAVPFSITDPDNRANYLLGHQVNTVINFNGGWRTWGDYAATANTDRQFYCQTRVEDVIKEGFTKALFYIISQPLIEDQVTVAMETMQKFLDALTQDKKIYGGRVEFKADGNGVDALKLGKIVLKYRAFAPPPITQIALEYEPDERFLELEVQSLIARSNNSLAA